MPTLDEVFNFAIANVSQGYDASATSIQLATGEGSRFPTGACNLVYWNKTTYPNPADDPNREIVRQTARNGDVLTIARGQETGKGGLPPSTKNTAGVTYAVALVATAKLRDDLESKAVDIGAQTKYATETGAKGDGVTDDTTAFTNGLAAANLFIIPPGTYVIDGDLLPHSNLTIQGAGVGVTVLKLKNSSAKSLFKASSLVDRVTFQDLTIDGNEANCPSGLDGIHIEKSTRLTLKNIEVTRCRRDAVRLGGAASGTTKYLTVRDCNFSECRGDLVRVENRSNDNTGNRVHGSNFSTPGFSVSTYQVGLIVWGPVSINGCTVDGVATNAGGFDLGADDGTFGNGAHGSVVTNCRILGTPHASNVCFGITHRAKRCRFSEVYVEGPDIGIDVLATNGDDNRFENCTLFNCGDRGFRIAGDRNTVQGCHIEGATKSIEITSAAADTWLLNNFIGGTAGNKVQNDSSSTHARNNRNWITDAMVETADIATDSAGDQGGTVAHGLDVTPAAIGINLSLRYTAAEPATWPNVRGPMVVAVDGTNVDIQCEVSTSGSAGSNFRIVAHITGLP